MRAIRSPKWKATGRWRNWLVLIVADGEAGFGGAECLRAPEGHDRRRRRWVALGGSARLGEEVRPPRWQVLIPTQQHIRTMTSARLAADVADVPTSSSPAPTPRRRR
jgi:isocitrate lyase